jgi:hypothetical protein
MKAGESPAFSQEIVDVSAHIASQFAGKDLAALVPTFFKHKPFPLTLDIVEDSPIDALAYLVVVLKKATHDPQLSTDSLLGHFLVDNDAADDSQ